VTGTPVNHYEAVIADLEAKIAAMQSMVDNLRAMAGSGPTSSTPSPQSGGSTVSFPNDAFFGMTVADATKKYLAAIKKTASVATISEALVAGGWKTSAKNIPENVRALVSRTPGIVRVNGEFGLAEWYPGRKTPLKRPIVTTNTPEDSMGAVPLARAVYRGAGVQPEFGAVPVAGAVPVDNIFEGEGAVPIGGAVPQPQG
jgi:hypothetical protein